MKTKIGFSIYLNGKLIREVTFDRPIINVGKLSTSNLRLDDINVSRKHAVIEQRENGQWRITDLGSTNGSIVRGERKVQADLHDGDRLVLGTTTLLVHLDEQAVAKVEQKDKLDKRASGVAGDVKKAPAADQPAEEIRGLGEDSFFKRKQVGEDASGAALEVALLWGETVLAVETFKSPQTIAIGEAQGCRFTVPQEALGGKRFDLITATKGGKFGLNLSNPNLEGDVLVGGEVKSLGALRESGGDTFVMDQPARGRFKVGNFTLLVTYGAIPTRTGVGAVGGVDYDAWIYIAISAIVHIAFLVVISYLPEDLLLSQRDPRAMKERAIQVLRVEPEEKEEEEEEKEEEEEDEDKKKVGADASKEEDKLKAAETQVVEAPPVKRPSDFVDRLTMNKKKEREAFEAMSEDDRRKRAKELSQMTALNEAFRNENPLFNELLNTNPDLDNQPNQFKALTSRADPNAPADSFAAGAIDPFGGTLGSGGGGFQTADGGVGPGGPGGGGPAVAGVFDGKDRRRGLNDIKFNERPADPKIIQMKPRLTGELDAKTVQQYIRRYLSGIKWCYQDRLQRNRKLRGKLTLAFTILPNGRVLDPQTKNSTVRDADLEACIVKKMSRWKFPSPKDGGLVQVQYPLILKTQ